MSMQYSVTYRNAQLDAFATAVGASPHLYINTGAQPANCAAADSGTNLVDMTLPSTPFNAAGSGSMTKNGTWSGAAGASGTAGHFRLKTSGGTCHAQGSITATGGGGDLELDNTNIASTQIVTIGTFTLNAGGS